MVGPGYTARYGTHKSAHYLCSVVLRKSFSMTEGGWPSLPVTALSTTLTLRGFGCPTLVRVLCEHGGRWQPGTGPPVLSNWPTRRLRHEYVTPGGWPSLSVTALSTTLTLRVSGAPPLFAFFANRVGAGSLGLPPFGSLRSAVKEVTPQAYHSRRRTSVLWFSSVGKDDWDDPGVQRNRTSCRNS